MMTLDLVLSLRPHKRLLSRIFSLKGVTVSLLNCGSLDLVSRPNNKEKGGPCGSWRRRALRS